MKVKCYFILIILGLFGCKEESKEVSIQDPNVRSSWRNFVDAKRQKIKKEAWSYASKIYHDLENTLEYDEYLLELFQKSPSVRKLDFFDSFTSTPQDISIISKFENLEVLILTSKWNSELPKGFDNLVDLDTLYLDLDSLAFLPKEIGNLKGLKYLHLEGESLIGFEEGSLDLPNLTALHIGKCNKGLVFPDAFGSLSKLNFLSLSGMDSIPPAIGDFKQLKSLVIEDVEHISSNIEQLKELEYLEISDGRNNFSFDVNSLSKLRVLNIYNSNIESLQFGVGMDALEYMRLSDIRKLPKGIGNLKALEFLDLERSNLEHLTGSITQASQLCGLYINSCQNFTELPSFFKDFPALIEIHLRYNGLENIPMSILESKSLKLINYFKESKLILPDEYLTNDKVFFTNLEITRVVN